MKRQIVLVCGWDGYIGFPLTLRLLSEGHVVYGVDNYSRRDSVKGIGGISATNISDPYGRRELLYKLGNFTHKDIDIVNQTDIIESLIKRVKFDTIINLAHNPSAPYSMISREHANYVLSNNIIGTNNLLWMIKQYCPQCHYITIGSTGEYSHTIDTVIEEGYFSFDHKGRKSKRCLFPREANSIYHASKVSSTYLIDYLTRLWGLKCTDVMQAVVYGIYTPECDKWKEYTRLDTDDCFGTVINRFIVQSMINKPMTIFGHGKHSRGFIALNDSIQALMIAINNPAECGKVQTWNQLSEWASIQRIAEIIKNIIPNSKTINIDSPRNEFTGGHFYEYNTDTLKNLGYAPTRTMIKEIEYMIDKVNVSGNEGVLETLIQPKIVFN